MVYLPQATPRARDPASSGSSFVEGRIVEINRAQAQSRNWQQPISRLPIELWRTIIDILLEAGSVSANFPQILAVCQDWRKIAQEYPKMWSNIFIEDWFSNRPAFGRWHFGAPSHSHNLSRLETHLQLSQPSLMSVIVVMFGRDPSGTDVALFGGMLQLVLTHAIRFDVFQCSASLHLIRQVLPLPPLIPNLRVLDIAVSSNSIQNSAPDHPTPLPLVALDAMMSVRTLRIRVDHALDPCLSLINASRCSELCLSGKGTINMSHLRQLLSCADELKSFSYSIMNDSDKVLDAPTNHLIGPPPILRLEYLSVIESQILVLNQVASLVQTQHLKVDGIRKSNACGASVLSHFHSLRSVTLAEGELYTAVRSPASDRTARYIQAIVSSRSPLSVLELDCVGLQSLDLPTMLQASQSELRYLVVQGESCRRLDSTAREELRKKITKLLISSPKLNIGMVWWSGSSKWFWRSWKPEESDLPDEGQAWSRFFHCETSSLMLARLLADAHSRGELNCLEPYKVA